MIDIEDLGGCDCSAGYSMQPDHAPSCPKGTPPTIDAPERREAVARDIASRLLDDKVHDEARRRHISDATQSGYDHHLVRVAAEMAVLALLAASSGERGVSGWMPIETAPMWQVAVVTDGENVAISQKAESDFERDGFYWAVEPEDALEWTPTHWIPTPATVEEPKV